MQQSNYFKRYYVKGVCSFPSWGSEHLVQFLGARSTFATSLDSHFYSFLLGYWDVHTVRVYQSKGLQNVSLL